jgi:phage gp45-like
MLEQNTMSFNAESWVESPTGRLYGIYRGSVVKGSIKTTIDKKQILADVYLYENLPPLFGVPVMSSKANFTNGEWHDLEDGDLVVVQFLSGNPSDPVIIGTLPIAGNDMQTENKADLPRYHLHHQGTDILIDKDGNRIITVAGNETLTIKGDGKVVVTEGNLEIEVRTGDVTITVTGDASITARNVTVTANEKATVDAPLLECTGNVDIADTTTADMIVDKNGSLDALRQAYLAHTHVENGAGGGTTDPPSGG